MSPRTSGSPEHVSPRTGKRHNRSRRGHAKQEQSNVAHGTCEVTTGQAPVTKRKLPAETETNKRQCFEPGTSDQAERNELKNPQCGESRSSLPKSTSFVKNLENSGSELKTAENSELDLKTKQSNLESGAEVNSEPRNSETPKSCGSSSQELEDAEGVIIEDGGQTGNPCRTPEADKNKEDKTVVNAEDRGAQREFNLIGIKDERELFANLLSILLEAFGDLCAKQVQESNIRHLEARLTKANLVSLLIYNVRAIYYCKFA